MKSGKKWKDINEEYKAILEKKWTELTKKIEEKEKMKQELFANMDLLFEGEIKPVGDGGHILIPKKYIGRKAKIVILKQQEEEDKKV